MRRTRIRCTTLRTGANRATVVAAGCCPTASADSPAKPAAASNHSACAPLSASRWHTNPHCSMASMASIAAASAGSSGSLPIVSAAKLSLVSAVSASRDGVPSWATVSSALSSARSIPARAAARRSARSRLRGATIALQMRAKRAATDRLGTKSDKTSSRLRSNCPGLRSTKA